MEKKSGQGDEFELSYIKCMQLLEKRKNIACYTTTNYWMWGQTKILY